MLALSLINVQKHALKTTIALETNVVLLAGAAPKPSVMDEKKLAISVAQAWSVRVIIVKKMQLPRTGGKIRQRWTTPLPNKLR